MSVCVCVCVCVCVYNSVRRITDACDRLPSKQSQLLSVKYTCACVKVWQMCVICLPLPINKTMYVLTIYHCVCVCVCVCVCACVCVCVFVFNIVRCITDVFTVRLMNTALHMCMILH